MIVKIEMKPGITDEEAWGILLVLGVDVHSSLQEEDRVILWGAADDLEQACDSPAVFKVEPIEEIDWTDQWEKHALGFQDGRLPIPWKLLGSNKEGNALSLLPGPGFGDLSHPTTQLMLELMSSYVTGKRVLDIGCGSGILSLSSLKMGAECVYGVDIDPQAIAHTQLNASNNDLSCWVGLPEEFEAKGPGIDVFLMNMIHFEQEIAWEALRSLHQKSLVGIVSGVLCDQKESYQNWLEQKGYRVSKETTKDGWFAGVIEKV